MTEAAEGEGAAYDATVLTTSTTEELRKELIRRGELPLIGQDLLDRYADEAEQAVAVIEAKLAGMKESLATAKTEAKRLRAEAAKGASG
jgi:hypothetical protein